MISPRCEDSAKQHREVASRWVWIDFVETGLDLPLFFLIPDQSQGDVSNIISRRHGLSRLTNSMPRRKAAERDQPHRRRSRNGCLNCRRRKIRCDEASPSCGYCVARGLTCSRGGVVLKWEAEYADNGLAFGRQGVGPAAGL
jgi:hypothetical protein